jgi:hypothetical protein
MSGLAPSDAEVIAPGVEVEIDDSTGADIPDVNERGDILRIEHVDGSVTVSLDGRPLGSTAPKKDGGWFANLCDEIDAGELSRISNDLLRGIDDDIESRRDWIEARTTGIKLLGLTVEQPGVTGTPDGAPVEGMSTVRHPLLLEAVLRFQANARSEMLPTDGPVKIRNDDTNDTVEKDQLADALEKDLNHYLTVTAPEYYPDTDRMLLLLGFGGTQFKKVYYCPLRQRPVSETVDADDLIVSNKATDLRNATRVTHRAYLRPSVVKRLQILGVYRDISLGDPLSPTLDSAQQAKAAQQGINPESMNPADRDREIYECYCELDIKGLEHEYEGAESGLEIPYIVTIDVSSRAVLSIIRNYDEDTKDLPEARTRFVKYTFVPGLGFYDIGLLHILGNTTKAVTAAWRELLDSGMFANFPGFLITKQGARQKTNILRVPPGGGAEVDTGGMPISQAIMPLPYNAQAMPALQALEQEMAQTGMRIGGTSEQQVGEGRADAPVGTTLAMIEQATKILNSVHKRMHASQCEEFRLLVDCFREHPESFVRQKCPSKRKWDEATFVQALSDCNLTPQADPNTSSQQHRMMKLQALALLAQAQPQLYDVIAINRAIIRGIGFSPDEFMAPASAMGQPTPQQQELEAKTASEAAKAKAEGIKANASMLAAQAKAGESQRNGQQPPDPAAMITAKARLMDAQTNHAEARIKHEDVLTDAQESAEDRASRERLAALQIAKEIMANPIQARAGAAEVKPLEKEAGV